MRRFMPVFAVSLVLSLTSCAWVKEYPNDSRPQYNEEQKPKTIIHQVPGGTYMEERSEAVPVERPLQPRLVKKQDLPQKTNNETEDEKIARLENEVSVLRNDIKMMMPALTRLVLAQEEVATLAAANSSAMVPMQPKSAHQKPQTLADISPQVLQDIAPAAGAPVVTKASTGRVMNVTPAPIAYKGHIGQIRFGVYPEKTRIVLDSDTQADISYDLDNNEQILILQLNGHAWKGGVLDHVVDSPIVQGYKIVEHPSGSVDIILDLKQKAKILWSKALPPVAGKPHRMIFDLASL